MAAMDEPTGSQTIISAGDKNVWILSHSVMRANNKQGPWLGAVRQFEAQSWSKNTIWTATWQYPMSAASTAIFPIRSADFNNWLSPC